MNAESQIGEQCRSALTDFKQVSPAKPEILDWLVRPDPEKEIVFPAASDRELKAGLNSLMHLLLVREIAEWGNRIVVQANIRRAIKVAELVFIHAPPRGQLGK